MTQADLLIHNIGQLATLAGPAGPLPAGPLPPGPRRGAAMRELGIIADGAVAIADGRIAAVGRSRDLRAAFQARATLDAGGRAVIPGFVDPHTHLPWAGHRAAEFEMRIGGATYMQIMAAGGGIARTVADTRAASLAELMAETRARLDRMLAYGTTTAEAKTGYGLNVADAAQGRERCGPTASALSTTKWSHREALGGLVHNAKFSQALFKTESDRAALRQLIETYLLRGGFEMQVNVVSRDTLLAAREHPEQYRDLLVRVAGYSDYFTKLSPKMQEEVIARTEHEI